MSQDPNTPDTTQSTVSDTANDTTDSTPTASADFSAAYQKLDRIRTEIRKAFIGQEAVIDQVLTAFLASGHVLIEGVPGLGKTLLVRCLAKCFAGDYARIQFTPDLMPSDVTGHAIYEMGTKDFVIRKGPAFTNLLLADEINRAPAKTQAALLEVMQEKQITIEGQPHKLDLPFMVLATQNPIEQEGTYPLPEAELDRFLMKVAIDYPELEHELALVKTITSGHIGEGFQLEDLQAVLSAAEVTELQQLVNQVELDDQVLDYAVRIVRSTRDWSGISKGAGPRGSLALTSAAKAYALIQGKNFVTPGDIKTIALPILRHRIQLSADMEIEGVRTDDVVHGILDQIEAPRS